MVCSHFGPGGTNELDLVRSGSIYSAFVGLVDDIVSQNSGAVQNGEAMSEPARTMTREGHPREDIVLVKPDVETIQKEARELELGRLCSVATQRLVWGNRRFIFR